MRSSLKRPADITLYVLIALVLYGVVIAWAVHEAKIGGSATLPLKWLGFAGMTGIVFGYAVRAGWRKRPGSRFWLALSIFAALHLGIGVLVLRRVEAVPLLLFGLVAGPEYLLLQIYLDFSLKRSAPGSGRMRQQR